MIIKDIMTPYTEVGKGVRQSLYIMHALALILIWCFVVPEKSMFPRLPEVLSAWKDLWNHGLFYHILKSLQLCGVAVLISIAISCTVAYLSQTAFFEPIAQFITKLRYNPIQGFTLFLMIAAGGGRSLQITLLVIFMSFYFINALMAILKEIPEEEFIRRRAQKMGGWEILWRVAIKDRADYLIEVIRQNISIMLMMIVSVEAMDKTQGGLGALLVDTNRNLAFPKIFALQLTILFIGMALDYLLKSVFNSFPANKKHA